MNILEQSVDFRGAAEAYARARLQRQEESILLVLQGKMRLSEWPIAFTQLAQCKTCKGFTMLSFPELHCDGLRKILKDVHLYRWQCDGCAQPGSLEGE
ncbi:MAG: hypothetical protein EOO38_00905 [Cytophagaceae bacterium]|nr:MAG: hypothetical protein EOO38_00905 [Cytophagaceae bacterium]